MHFSWNFQYLPQDGIHLVNLRFCMPLITVNSSCTYKELHDCVNIANRAHMKQCVDWWDTIARWLWTVSLFKVLIKPIHPTTYILQAINWEAKTSAERCNVGRNVDVDICCLATVLVPKWSQKWSHSIWTSQLCSTMPTREAPEWGTPRYKRQNVGSQWCVL